MNKTTKMGWLVAMMVLVSSTAACSALPEDGDVGSTEEALKKNKKKQPPRGDEAPCADLESPPPKPGPEEPRPEDPKAPPAPGEGTENEVEPRCIKRVHGDENSCKHPSAYESYAHETCAAIGAHVEVLDFGPPCGTEGGVTNVFFNCCR